MIKRIVCYAAKEYINDVWLRNHKIIFYGKCKIIKTLILYVFRSIVEKIMVIKTSSLDVKDILLFIKMPYIKFIHTKK